MSSCSSFFFFFSNFRAAQITKTGTGVPPITGPTQSSKQSGMGDIDWQPFVYGGLASCTAEFGKSISLLGIRFGLSFHLRV